MLSARQASIEKMPNITTQQTENQNHNDLALHSDTDGSCRKM